MRASDLRRRVVLQSRVQVGDGSGDLLLFWTDYIAGIATGASKAVASVVAGETTVIGCPAHGFYEGQLVQLAGITGLPGLPTTFGVLTPSADAFSIALDTTGRTLAVTSATATPMSGVPAEIEPVTGREALEAQAVTPVIQHRLRMRYHSMLVDPMKAAGLRALHVHGAVSRYFDLTPALNVDSRNREVTVAATEGLASSMR